MPRFLASPFQLPRRRQLNTAPNTTITIENKLLHIDEALTVQIHCQQTTRPPERLTIFSHYLKHVYKSQTDIGLAWEKTDGGWKTRFSFQPNGMGNYLIRFSNGTRDKINPYTRYFSVVDNKTSICSINHILDAPMANYHNIYHRYFIPADFEILFNRIHGKIESNPKWIGHNIYRYYSAKYGDNIFPRINFQYLPLINQNSEWLEKQLAGEKYSELAAYFLNIWECEFFYPKPEILGLEIPQQQLIEAVQGTQIKAITGLAADTQIAGTDNFISTQGMPLFPYFIKKTDFCASAAGSSPLVGFSTTGHPLLSHDYEAYQLSPAVAESFRYADSENMQSLYEFIEQFIRNRDLRTPNFISFELKAHYIPEVVQMNSQLMRHFVGLARKERIVFAQKVEIARYFQRRFQRTPERAFYLSDTYKHSNSALNCGSMPRQKPPQAHDCIYFENHEYRVCFRKAEMKPYYFYVYSRKNNKNTLTELDIAAIGIRCCRVYEPTFKYTIEIDCDQEIEQFPIAFWTLPFAFEEVKNKLQHNFNRFIPVIENESNSFNSIAIVKLTSGKNFYYLDFGMKFKRLT